MLGIWKAVYCHSDGYGGWYTGLPNSINKNNLH